jgi:hypothetical protein
MSHWIDILEDSSTKKTIYDYIFKNQDIPDLKNIYIYKWEFIKDEFERMEITVYFYFPMPKNINKKVFEKSNVTSGNFTLYPIENFNYDFNNSVMLEDKLEVFNIELIKMAKNKFKFLAISNYGNIFESISRGISLLNFGYSSINNDFFKKLPTNYFTAADILNQ